jgi:hypothetical protein
MDKQDLEDATYGSSPRKKQEEKSAPDKPNVTFSIRNEVGPNEEEKDQNLQGNFQHLKNKTKKFDYKDYFKGPDTFFHADVATECETYYQSQRIRVNEKRTEHFAFIVDLDSYEYHKVVFHSFLNEILQSSFFRCVNGICFMIMTFGSILPHTTLTMHEMGLTDFRS